MYQLNTDDDVVRAALNILEQRLEYGPVMGNPETVRSYLKLEVMGLEHEVFGCLWLNNRHNVIRVNPLFRGTIDAAAVYPREVVKEALQVNAASVIFYHNHPSGDPSPSSADLQITRQLSSAARAIEIPMIDHVILGRPECDPASRGYYSFREAGLL